MCPSRKTYKPIYEIPTSYRRIISVETAWCIYRVLPFLNNKKLDYFFSNSYASQA